MGNSEARKQANRQAKARRLAAKTPPETDQSGESTGGSLAADPIDEPTDVGDPSERLVDPPSFLAVDYPLSEEEFAALLADPASARNPVRMLQAVVAHALPPQSMSEPYARSKVRDMATAALRTVIPESDEIYYRERKVKYGKGKSGLQVIRDGGRDPGRRPEWR